MGRPINTIKTILLSLVATSVVSFAGEQMAPNRFAPFGWWETAADSVGAIHLKGWAVDAQSPNPVAVQVLVNGQVLETIWANLPRPDVERAYGMGSLRGFNATIPSSPGTHQVCLSMRNVYGGANVSLGCRQLTVVNQAPFGWWESAVAEKEAVRIKGWAVDFDSFEPVTVLVHIGNQRTEMLADLPRPDVERAFGMGDLRGFNATISAPPGTHQVCLTLENIPAGPNVSLGCTNLTVEAIKPVWPGASNTGVPPGTKLTVHEGDLKITQNNTVIDSMEIRGLVRIEAKNVLIKNSRITGRLLNSPLSLIYVNGPNYSVTVQDSELYAKHPSPYISGIIGWNFTLERVNIHNVIDQVHVIGDNVLVKDSWLHSNLHYKDDPFHSDGSHDDNIQIQQGNNIRIIHNTLTSSHTASVIVTQDTGVVSNLLIEKNHISNGACSLNLAEKSRGTLKGFVLRDNVFTRTQVYAGCAALVDSTSVPLLSLSNNTWVDGSPISITRR